MTQALATVFEQAIREHPEDWHMLQKVFVNDLDPDRLARSRARAGAVNGTGALPANEAGTRLAGGAPVRIGIACPYSWDVPGGVQQHIRDLAEALIDLGHEVSVIAPADEDRPLPPYVVPAGKAMPVPYNGSVARLAFGPLSTHRVRRWLRDGNFDVLHVHEPAVPSLSLLACWVASGPIVATVHTAMRKSRVLLATQPVLRSALEKIDGRIAVSEAARSTFVEHLGGDAVLIPNGVATRRYLHADPLDGWPGEGGAIGFLGRMDEPRKGLAVLLRAFELLAPERPGPAAAHRRPWRHRRAAALAPRGPARPRRVPRRGVGRGQGPRPALRRRLLLAEHGRRVLRHRHRRGDGGRRADRRVRHPRVPRRAPQRPGGRAVRHR